MSGWPVVVISREELAALLEYSTSLPTGTTPGKRWRRNVQVLRRPVGEAEWAIGEYGPIEGNYIQINWYWALDENHDVHRGDLRKDNQK